MEFEQILTLISHVSDSKLTSFRYESGDLKLSLECGQPMEGEAYRAAPNVWTKGQEPPSALAEPSVPVPDPQGEEKEGNLVKSPLVGTFYAAPAEDAEPFAAVGDTVKKGQILAIVEAMKLMNEIESDFDGEIKEIYVKNGEAVEYGQPLFRIA